MALALNLAGKRESFLPLVAFNQDVREGKEEFVLWEVCYKSVGTIQIPEVLPLEDDKIL